ncbi:molybdenum ABC transporter permease [Janibacter sp. Soil728]|uniref:ABC transporter permease n=1 Tax=Janibacter sp. Soil728 TaxID=1736393 RepID=UPI0006FEB477|nr:ABC transporter permease [Janibacter sp. Soil728]KRE36057.1 molybdenum ABC transporter permease [Janibacter sp. Soil728]
MKPPVWLWIPASGAILVVVLPLLGLLSSVDVGSLWPLLTSEASVTALLLSLRTSLAATALCIVLGAPLALLLARGSWRGQSTLRALVLVPLVLPPVVGGLALLTTFGRRGLIGEHLVAAGLSISYSTTAVVLAQTFVALPFLVLSLEGAVRGLDRRQEEAAATLGASPWRRLTRVTLPLVAPGLLSGSVLAFARALGEFGATLTFAGSAQGRTRTLPLEIYLQREVDPDAAIALSLVLVVLATVIVGSVYARTTRAAA